MDDRELFENSYYYFIDALEALSAVAEEQCEIMGFFNVAYEIKDDVSNGKHLLQYKFCNLSKDQRGLVLELINSLESVPDYIVSFTEDIQESSERMKHPSWEPLRKKAKRLLLALKPITEANKEYFEEEAKKPFTLTSSEVASYLEHALKGTIFRQDWERFVNNPIVGCMKMDAVRKQCSLLDKFRATGSGENVSLTDGARSKIENLLKQVKN